MSVLIGVVSNKKMVEGKLQSAVYFDYVHSIEIAGGTPLIIPLIDQEEYMDSILNHLDGLLFPGGGDVHPKWFNQEIHPSCGTIHEELDSFEIKLIKKALKRDIPLLAICRGVQVLNIACNGDIYQDLTEYPNHDESIIHSQEYTDIAYHLPIHEVSINKDSLLYNIFGDQANTNSFHHQVIHHIGDGLKCTATTKDGVIEGLEGINNRFVVGVQWHPEKMVDTSIEQLNLFKQFINACRYK